MSALDLDLQEDPETFPTGDQELDAVLSGGLVRPSSATIFGKAGSGKSRSAVRWATHLGSTLLVSLEMPKKLAGYSAKSARAELANLHITESETDWQSKAAKVKAGTVVLDSFHYSRKQRVLKGTKVPLICHELGEWTKQTGGIALLISHQNAKGRASGETHIEHWPDYLFKFEAHGKGESKIIVQKSRYCPIGSAIVQI